MAGVIRSLVTKILFQSDETGLKKVETNTAAAKREMRAASRAAYALKRDLHGLQVTAGGLVGVVAGGMLAKFFVSDFAKSTDAAAKFADSLGLDIEVYQGFIHAAELNGAKIEQVNPALAKLGAKMQEAAGGSKELQKAFGAVGFSMEDLKTLNVEQAIYKISDGMQKLGAGGKRTQVAMKLFEETGPKLALAFSQGSAALKETIAQAKKFGIVMTRDQARIAENYNDEMLRAKSVLLGVRNIIALQILPALTKAARGFVKWASTGDNLRDALRKLKTAAKFLAVALAAVIAAKIGGAFTTLIGIVAKAVFWFRTLGWASLFAYAKMMLIVGLIALVGLAIDDLYHFMKGDKDSFFGRLFGRLGVAKEARAAINGVIDAVKRLWGPTKAVGAFLLRVIGSIMGASYRIWQAIMPVLQAIGSGIMSLFGSLSDAWTQTLKPAVMELGKALNDLYVAAKPTLELIWTAFKAIAGIVWKFALTHLTVLAEQFRIAFLIAAKAIEYVAKIVSGLITAITWLVNKLVWAAEKLGELTGLVGPKQELGGSLKKFSTEGKTGTQNNSLSVGAVSVSVQGTADMSPEQFAGAVKNGTKDALQDIITGTMASFRNLVPG